MNVMISCVGRQTLLVSAFCKALNGEGLLIATDNNQYAPGLELADIKLVSPAFNSEIYTEWILESCKKYNIELLLTFNVDDLLVLEKQREKFIEINCRLIGGPVNSIKITQDKYRLYTLCKKLGLLTPKTWILNSALNESDLNFPIIAKPSLGKGSRGIEVLDNIQSLHAFVKFINSQKYSELYVLQEYFDGQEYGFDIINNLNGEFVSILLRKKFVMKNGETDIAITKNPDTFEAIGKKLGEILKHQGVMDADAIKVGNDIFLIDLNFRFGGGYAFSHLAGANIPLAIVCWASNKKFSPKLLEAKQNVLGARSTYINQIEKALK